MQQITIIGTGLIGASFGLAVKAAGFQGQVIGCDQAQVLEQAQARGAIDKAITSARESVRGSQLIVLAVPVLAIIELIDQLAPILPEACLLTDVGSTKAEIMARANAAFGARSAACFLGGHPMAGKEHSGVLHASAELFRGAAWLLTPTESQRLDRGPISGYVDLLGRMGAKPISIDAQQHDRLCAWISHVPQMIATALAGVLVEEFASPAGNGLTLSDVHEVGGRALREMTRIAASPYSMWGDIATTNRSNIEADLLAMERKLASMRANLGTTSLEDDFTTGNRFAESREKAKLTADQKKDRADWKSKNKTFSR